jgi:hypothetical protein
MDFSIRERASHASAQLTPALKENEKSQVPLPQSGEETKRKDEIGSLAGRVAKTTLSDSGDDILKFSQYTYNTVEYLGKVLAPYGGYVQWVEPFIIKDRLCLWIGDIHHQGPSKEITAKFHDDAAKGLCAFFKEGMLANPQVSTRVIKAVLYFEHEPGHNYGLEDPMFLISIAANISCRIASKEPTVFAEKSIPWLLFQIVFDSTGMEIWKKMCESTVAPKIEHMKKMLSAMMQRLIDHFEDAESTLGAIQITVEKDHDSTSEILAQYVLKGAKMLNLPQSTIGGYENLLLHHRYDIEYLDKITGSLMGSPRDESMAKNFLKMLDGLPPEMPAIIQMGRSHKAPFLALMAPHRDDLRKS